MEDQKYSSSNGFQPLAVSFNSVFKAEFFLSAVAKFKITLHLAILAYGIRYLEYHVLHKNNVNNSIYG